MTRRINEYVEGLNGKLCGELTGLGGLRDRARGQRQHRAVTRAREHDAVTPVAGRTTTRARGGRCWRTCRSARVGPTAGSQRPETQIGSAIKCFGSSRPLGTPEKQLTACGCSTVITNATHRKDFERVGIMPDAQGRVAHPHGLHSTLGTMLAREAVALQRAQPAFWRAHDSNTLKPDTELGDADIAEAVGK